MTSGSPTNSWRTSWACGAPASRGRPAPCRHAGSSATAAVASTFSMHGGSKKRPVAAIGPRRQRIHAPSADGPLCARTYRPARGCAHKVLCQRNRNNNMLYTIAIILVVLWLLGLVSSYTMGGFIHVLLVIAIVMILLQFIQGR